MADRAAKPRKVTHSEKLDRLHRLKMDFAVKPFSADNERWAPMRVSESAAIGKVVQEKEHKRMIREVDKGVKGLDFPAEEMAKILRGWMASDD